MKPELQRQVFTISREMEYFSESELVAQMCYAKYDWWPRALVKELVDNSLDACEQAGTIPEIEIRIDFTGSDLTVADSDLAFTTCFTRIVNSIAKRYSAC